ncbi:MAG: hypothetical protein BGN92_13680 [Sphingobacteriales bacterium 41-5]|nr:MAG: hypothetical protein BGN92_13680 [Sphingobacteriales bacterium 41-5]
MKPKNFIKNKAKETAKETINKTIPVLQKPMGRLGRWARQRPYMSLAIMFSVVVLNIAALFAFTDTFSPISFSLKSIKQNVVDSTAQVSDMGIPFSFKNYREMTSIKDSLEYLMNKPSRTAADTALALRLFQKMEQLDPEFFNQFKHKNNDSTKIQKHR